MWSSDFASASADSLAQYPIARQAVGDQRRGSKVSCCKTSTMALAQHVALALLIAFAVALRGSAAHLIPQPRAAQRVQASAAVQHGLTQPHLPRVAGTCPCSNTTLCKPLATPLPQREVRVTALCMLTGVTRVSLPLFSSAGRTRACHTAVPPLCHLWLLPGLYIPCLSSHNRVEVL